MRVESAVREQFVVRPSLDDLAALEDEDLIGVLDRLEAVGDGEGGSIRREFVDRALDEHLRLGVDIAGRLV